LSFVDIASKHLDEFINVNLFLHSFQIFSMEKRGFLRNNEEIALTKAAERVILTHSAAFVSINTP